MTASSRKKPSHHPLVGKWFHSSEGASFEDAGVVAWQGHIVALVHSEPEPLFLVETYDWLIGVNTRQQIIALSRITAEHWRFYDTDEEMRAVYTYEYAPRAREKATAR